MTAGTAKAYSTDAYTDMNRAGPYIEIYTDEYGQVQKMEYDDLKMNVEQCSENFFSWLGIFSSTADRACLKRKELIKLMERRESNNSIDWKYRACVVSLAYKTGRSPYQDKAVDTAAESCVYIPAQQKGEAPGKVVADVSLFKSCSTILGDYAGDRFAALTGRYCALAKTYDYAQCVLTLGKNQVKDGKNQFKDGEFIAKLCNSSIAKPVSDCVFRKNLDQNVYGNQVIQSCREKNDPELIRQAEQRRLEEQRRRDAEIRAAQEAARREEAARLEAQRQADEQRRRDEQASVQKQNTQPSRPANTGKKEAPKKEQPKTKPAPSPAPAPAPQDPQNGNGDVITDLPNF